MPCPDTNVVLAFLQRALPPAETATLVRHFDRCDPCRQLLCDLEQARADSVPSPPPSPSWTSDPGDETQSDFFRSGKLVGRYVIRDLVGLGGMGAVYEAYDPVL